MHKTHYLAVKFQWHLKCCWGRERDWQLVRFIKVISLQKLKFLGIIGIAELHEQIKPIWNWLAIEEKLTIFEVYQKWGLFHLHLWAAINFARECFLVCWDVNLVYINRDGVLLDIRSLLQYYFNWLYGNWHVHSKVILVKRIQRLHIEFWRWQNLFFEVRVRIGDGPQEPLSKVLEDAQEHLLVVL